MRIVRAELYEMVIPYLQPFIISAGVMRERRSLVVVLQDESGHLGYGESPPDPLPFYSEETLSSARALISELLLPRVVGGEFETPEAIDRTLREGCDLAGALG